MTIFQAIIAAIFGVLFGNFATTYYHRLPLSKPINGISNKFGMKPHCSKCHHELKFYEYYPVLSWFSTRFSCNYCGDKIDINYFLIEFCSMVGCMLLSLFCGMSEYFALHALLVASTVLLFFLFIKYKRIFFQVLAFNLFLILLIKGLSYMSQLPKGFVYLSEIDPTIIEEPIYYSNDNFMGKRANGYNKPKIILTQEAANALKQAQAELKQQNLSFKVIDGYRPQSACDHFYAWAQDDSDQKMKDKFYPNIPNKLDLFKGYVARYSTHSRGSTVDLTIVDLNTNAELDMGSIIDMLDPISHVISDQITDQQQKNRLFLQDIMQKYGFEGYSKEWWHFQLIDEPFTRRPEDHFNFPVE